ncbi:hypothetical protein CXG81DRAFT_7136, partial [Caulochytrium protostelioides]
LKVDLHTHFLPPDLGDLRQFGFDPSWLRLELVHDADGTTPRHATLIQNGVPFRTLQPPCYDLAARLADFTRPAAAGRPAPVDVQVLSPLPLLYAYDAPAAHALALARHVNDAIAEACRAHPTRFLGLATVPLQDPAAAAAEVRRVAQQWGDVMRGVAVGTSVQGVGLDDRRFADAGVWDACVAADWCVFVHPWDMRGCKEGERYWTPWLVGMPLETTQTALHVLLSGLLERFPTLRMGFAHGGGALPYLLGRFDKGYACRPDLVAADAGGVRPSTWLARGRVWTDGLVHDPAALALLLRKIGPDRVMLGSDYPFPLGEGAPGEVLQ